MKNILLLFLVFLFFPACEQAVLSGVQGFPDYGGWKQDTQGGVVKRKWTFIVYMAADNDLESAAIADLNELEAVKLNGAPISILALVDRNPAFDMTNGNWQDTRLFEIKTDPNGLNSTIVSTRLDCPELGLSKDAETELNTADPLVLSRLIDFAKRSYSAEYYALFVWGHGTGWRSGPSAEAPLAANKAVAFDDTHGQYMALPSFGRAIADKGLSLIGFDICYAAVLELVYQIKSDAELFVGSEGEILSNGWDYAALFEDFLSKPELTVYDLGDSIQDQFAAQYAALSNATISQVRLAEVENLYAKFDDFAGAVALAITGESARNTVLDLILHNVEAYHFTSFPSDLYIDILDFSRKISRISTDITPDSAGQAAIVMAVNKLETALALAVPSSWAKNGTARKLGIHVIPLHGMSVPASSHELAYVRGSMAIDKSAFVENSLHWVPNATPKNDSLLDKLFYWTY